MSFVPRVSGVWRRERVRLALTVLSLVFCMAPTPGDVGGCGQKPAELDPGAFFSSKADVDCQRCQECNLASKGCAAACAYSPTRPPEFPDRCVPLVHDGEVCLRALQNASCEDYRAYLSDRAPSTPTECNFCRSPRRETRSPRSRRAFHRAVVGRLREHGAPSLATTVNTAAIARRASRPRSKTSSARAMPT